MQIIITTEIGYCDTGWWNKVVHLRGHKEQWKYLISQISFLYQSSDYSTHPQYFVNSSLINSNFQCTYPQEQKAGINTAGNLIQASNIHLKFNLPRNVGLDLENFNVKFVFVSYYFQFRCLFSTKQLTNRQCQWKKEIKLVRSKIGISCPKIGHIGCLSYLEDECFPNGKVQKLFLWYDHMVLVPNIMNDLLSFTDWLSEFLFFRDILSASRSGLLLSFMIKNIC